MHYPKIVVFESDGSLAATLNSLIDAHADEKRRWLLRESMERPACLNLLAEYGPAVLVMKVGRHLVRELTFLDEIHTVFPDVPIVAVGDVEDNVLMSLILELGASFVVQPPQSRQQLSEVVARLMKATISRMGAFPEIPDSPSTEPRNAEPTHEPQS